MAVTRPQTAAVAEPGGAVAERELGGGRGALGRGCGGDFGRQLLRCLWAASPRGRRARLGTSDGRRRGRKRRPWRIFGCGLRRGQFSSTGLGPVVPRHNGVQRSL